MYNLDYYITGDCHGVFEKVKYLSRNIKDPCILFILGDVGLNWDFGVFDKKRKSELSSYKNISFICLRGNHDANHQKMKNYKVVKKYCGKMYVEKEYPNIYFTKDGEIYNIEGKKILCIGGAYSVDKQYRLENGWTWFEDEQPQIEDKKNTYKNLLKHDFTVDYVFYHTCPMSVRPDYAFLNCISQESVDTSTEEWMESLVNDGLVFDKWFCGHYHVDAVHGRYNFLYNNLLKLDMEGV